MMRALAWLALTCALPANAIDRIQLRVASVTAGDFGLADVEATLQIQGGGHSAVELRAAKLIPPESVEVQAGTISAVHLQCNDPVILEPRFECPDFNVQASSTRWAEQHANGKAAYRSDTGDWSVQGAGTQVAGRPLEFLITGAGPTMQAQLGLHSLQLPQVKEFLLAQKLPVPDLVFTGTGDLEALVDRSDSRFTARIELSLHEAGYQNADYTMVGEKLSFKAQATADLVATPITFEAHVAGINGQALAGPVLLDLEKNPLQLTLAGTYTPQVLQLTSFRSEQRDLAVATGSAELTISPFAVKTASIDATDVRFPAAYASFMQIALAATPFNQLTVTGTASLHAEIRDNQPAQIDIKVDNLAFSDTSRELTVNGVNSEVHWTRGLTGPPRPSWLAWESSQGWGIIGATSRIDFTAHDREFHLARPARLPFFDGALRINTLSAEQIGTDSMSGVFDAVIEPISVAPIAKALGLPAFEGKLAGTIPGLTYKDKVLSLQGNLEADVFDGHVVASNLRIREPLGAWPRLYGDIVARNLDLQLLTSTFEFGSITGRLDVDLTGFETFNWSPVAFDLTLATPKGDRSKHRISQRAVGVLSDLGGTGGGVTKALQSGFLQFFDDFNYDRIGFSCRLRNEICQMAGVEPVGNSFYIVKGRGLPRIDIIGNNHLVDWPVFASQVRDAIRNPGNIELK